LNLAPLDHDIHAYGIRDHADFRRVLLRIVYEKASYAVAIGRYEWQKRDSEFMAWANRWLESKSLPSLYHT
jgi:hypothetical protein